MQKLILEARTLLRQVELGGAKKYREREKERGKLLVRERISYLCDKKSDFLEVGALLAYDNYGGTAPAMGVVTGVGQVCNREVVIVANDSTVKSGSWYPETITKILRAQEIAMRCRIPIIYLVDSAGVNLPYQGGVFPGQYGASRIFYYNSIMRHHLKVPQISAVVGQCVAGGAYLPALSDVIIMTAEKSFMGLGGPNLVKGATGESVSGEFLGGALTHNSISGVAHYIAKNDEECLDIIRKQISELPPIVKINLTYKKTVPPKFSADEILGIIPEKHQTGYDTKEILLRIVDNSEFDEFQEHFAKELITCFAYIEGIPVGILANQRLTSKTKGKIRIGGVIYPESAKKAEEFIQLCDRRNIPLLFIQDVTGFMIGTEAEHEGIIRAGAGFVEAMATCKVPKIVLTTCHASGAGYYAMAGQGFDPDFILSFPTGRMGVMEGESAVKALYGPQIEKLEKQGLKVESDVELSSNIDYTRKIYENQLLATYAAARGFVDAIVFPNEVRAKLGIALRASVSNPGFHL
ncbi:acyl-CoA carboxylase subunit beta, partial [bacterium]|nr:acyl-CoA carboxylase subunit beta [bacterium]